MNRWRYQTLMSVEGATNQKGIDLVSPEWAKNNYVSLIWSVERWACHACLLTTADLNANRGMEYA
jgi:hypothetical protein